MHKRFLTILALGSCLLTGNKAVSQDFQTFLDVSNFLQDALWYADTFITPATDAAVYQASSSWVATPQKKKLWDVNVSIHTNAFFVPKKNREFTVTNDDLAFFRIEDGRESATVQTALGNDEQIYLVGELGEGEDAQQVRLKTPEGIDMSTVVYPYIQASLGMWYGTEIIGKYSYKVKLKRGYYRVYGGGIKHNLSQYFKSLEAKNLHFSAFAGYSNEEISFGFLNAQTEQYGQFGLNEITGFVDTYQFQLNGSKKWQNVEVMGALIANTSDIKYEVGGTSGTPFFIAPIKQYVNDQLEQIYKTRTNVIGEVSGRYQFGHFFAQASFAFGKFANSNLSIQYEL
ncbi:DUF6588 family protein [Flavobacterium sp.]|uniref:DUF6588 family protein n=1 Tax=Flavobacterium sp. TaxID=239 RepID=UPI0039E6F42E